MTSPSHPNERKTRAGSVLVNGPFDILWGRPIFRAPPLLNPRVIFDPPPFRTLIPSIQRVPRGIHFSHLKAA